MYSESYNFLLFLINLTEILEILKIKKPKLLFFFYFSDCLSKFQDNCYEIDPAFLPSHIPYSLASKIFSLGKFMIQIKHNPSNKIPGILYFTIQLVVMFFPICLVKFN